MAYFPATELALAGLICAPTTVGKSGQNEDTFCNG